MKTRVAINGFGRIGRLAFRNLIEDDAVEVVAFNDLANLEMLVHLLKFDTAHGAFPHDVAIKDEDTITIDGHEIQVYKERDPEQLPWGALNIDVVLESTGVFLSTEMASKHLNSGAQRVVLSAPAKSADIRTIVLGVNDEQLDAEDKIVSNASCTTNCLAPMAKVIQDSFGLEQGYITTIHAYTADQRLQDAPHSKDFRRARAAAANMIPTSTGAAKAVGLVLPELQGKLDGMAVRVPVITGSLTDCSFIMGKETSAEEVNAAMQQAAEGPLKGILQYSEDPLVSSDIIGNRYSCIFDAQLTSVNGKFLKMSGWYDNEAGYAKRAAELAVRVGQLIQAGVSA